MSPGLQGVVFIFSFLALLYVPVTIIAYRNTGYMSAACRWIYSATVFPLVVVLIVGSVVCMDALLPGFLLWVREIGENAGRGSPPAAIAGGVIVLPVCGVGIYCWHWVFCHISKKPVR